MNIDDDRIPIDAIQEIEEGARWSAIKFFCLGFLVSAVISVIAIALVLLAE